MPSEKPAIPVPSASVRYLAEQTDALAEGDPGALRLTPLLLQRPLDEFLSRRGRAYGEWEAEKAPVGFRIRFGKRLKSSRSHPNGHMVEGEFDVLALSTEVCVLSSPLGTDADKRGPQLLAERAYPLATRPFLSSARLHRYQASRRVA